MFSYRCVRCLQQVDIEYKTLKAKLQDMFNVSGDSAFSESFW